MRPVILGLDLATQVGWCAGDGGSLPVSDSFRLPATGDDIGRFLLEARSYYRILLDRFRPQVCVMEAPIRTTRTDGTTLKLHGLACVLEMECSEQRIELAQVYPVSIKARIAGSGRAEKKDVMAAVRRAGMKPKNTDESDACGAWLCGIREYSPDLWSAWADRLKGVPHDLP